MFHSSRGSNQINSFEAIINGLASDGGLYVIDRIPKINYKNLIGKSYEEVATEILKAYFNEFTYDEIFELVTEAYNTFPSAKRIVVNKTKQAYFLELFHGPTLAFKDMALVILPRLFSLAKKKLGIKEDYNILTATSGDTGGAALNGFKGVEGVNIFVLYPNDGVSEIQERQMLSFKNKNAHVIGVNGNFDDCQSIVKEFFSENKDYNLSSANSMNIARLIPQIVYYYYTYLELLSRNEIIEDEELNFVVPTGNFGNIFAAFLAKQMGLPIKNLICASNKNNILTEFFKNGIYNKNRIFYKTNSPSMDIIVSSNLERFIYYACGKDINRVKEIMTEFKINGKYEFVNPYNFIFAYYATEIDTNKTIKDLYNSDNYIIDTHTSVAYKAYTDYKKETNDHTKTVIVSTASPFKFPGSVLKALNLTSSDSEMANIQILSDELDIEIPKALNYNKFEKEVWELNEVKGKLKELMK